MTGLEHKPRIPLDYMHSDQVIGYADTFDVDQAGLTIGGYLTPARDDDRAAEILAKAKAGVPWEALGELRRGQFQNPTVETGANRAGQRLHDAGAGNDLSQMDLAPALERVLTEPTPTRI